MDAVMACWKWLPCYASPAVRSRKVAQAGPKARKTAPFKLTTSPHAEEKEKEISQ